MSRDEENEYFADGLVGGAPERVSRRSGAARARRGPRRSTSRARASTSRRSRASSTSRPCSRAACASPGNARARHRAADPGGERLAPVDRDLRPRRSTTSSSCRTTSRTSVVKELRSALLGEAIDAKASADVRAEVAAASSRAADDPEAFRLYLQGRFLYERMTAESVAHGVELSCAPRSSAAGGRSRSARARLSAGVRLRRSGLWLGPGARRLTARSRAAAETRPGARAGPRRGRTSLRSPPRCWSPTIGIGPGRKPRSAGPTRLCARQCHGHPPLRVGAGQPREFRRSAAAC